NEEDKPISIIRDAGKVVAKHKEKVTYMTPAGCEKLFQYKYPLAWGNKEVEADAFLTGVVRISPDKAKTTVVIEALERKSKKLHEVTNFEVKTERTILSDVCENFALDSRTMRTAGPDDEEAVQDYQKRDKAKGVILADNRLVDLRIVYGGH